MSLDTSPEFIRSVIILAHVDHGKTTLTDSLLSYEGVISHKQAGQLRFLDNRPDEQERGITMKSSSVVLHYKPISMTRLYPSSGGYLSSLDHLAEFDSLETIPSNLDASFTFHLIDSPGHIDFYGQVFCASRLSDGCLIMIDVVEGVCSQTMSAFRLASSESHPLTPILFLNKIDRLFLDLNLNSHQAYLYLYKLLENVNAAAGSFRTLDQDAEEPFYFDPRKGNVIFGSSLDGWAFRTNLFANLYSKKFDLDKSALNQHLWGSFSLKLKSKSYTSSSSSLFIQFILENIWALYDALLIKSDTIKLAKIVETLGISCTERELASKDKRGILRLLFQSWLPIAPTVYDSFIDQIPAHTIESISSEPIFYMTKILPNSQASIQTNDSELVGLCRLIQGTLSLGDTLYMLEDPSLGPFKVVHLYKLFGSDRVPVNSVASGHLFGFGFRDDPSLKMIRSATFSTNIHNSPMFTSKTTMSYPIVKVAIEPRDLSHLVDLQHALLDLYRSDPSLLLEFTDSGELLLSTCGELHLEQSLKDIRDAHPAMSICVSEPIVPYRETVDYDHSFPKDSPLADVFLQDVLGDDILVFEEKRGDIMLTKTALDPWNNIPFQLKIHLLLQNIHSASLENTLTFDPLISDRYWPFLKNGFSAAMKSGSLLAEPLMNIHMRILSVSIKLIGKKALQNLSTMNPEPMQPVTHSDDDSLSWLPRQDILISIFKSMCHRAILTLSPRIAIAMARSEFTSTSDAIGKVFALISKSHGKVIDESFFEDSGIFLIHAQLPMSSTFGFADELRSKTSGSAHVQLAFEGFSVLEEDPFWIPSTEEELMLYGVKGDKESESLKVLKSVRKKKGMLGDERLVHDAEKQRTLKR